MRVHHVGVLVPDIAAGSKTYQEQLGYGAESEITFDPLQQAYLQMLRDDNGTFVELIQPADEKSKLHNLLQKRGSGPVHLCYSVNDIDQKVAQLRQSGFLPILPPTPAELFSGKRVAFFLSSTQEIIELVEE